MLTGQDIPKDLLLEALDALSDGIAIYDENDRPIYVSAPSRRGFGPFFELLDSGAPMDQALRQAITELRPTAGEAEISAAIAHFLSCYREGRTNEARTYDGRVVQASYRPMAGNRKVAISVDITDIRTREEELRAARLEADAARREAETASAAKSAFLANMSHEIRTPLNGILGMAQVLAMGELNAEQREQVSTVLESGQTLMALLNDVLDLSKIEAGKLDLSLADADLHQVLSHIRDLWTARADEKGLGLALSFDADMPRQMTFDAVRVQQCVSNLVSNAIKFTEAGRVDILASVTCQPDGDFVVAVSVRDTGIGMDEEASAGLFQPFAQADESISRRFGGTGLGLSITRKLALLMGGDVSVGSEPGNGSEFTVTFKAKPSASHRPAASDMLEDEDAQRAALIASRLRILLVDDHPVNRRVASLFLKRFQPTIVEAHNGEEALEALAREPFDVVLLDMHMPVMDGPAAIKHIRQADADWRSIPVIALTADAMGGDRERYLAMGMSGYLSKPLSERDLVSEILRVRNAAV